jgi:hypothetical protein
VATLMAQDPGSTTSVDGAIRAKRKSSLRQTSARVGATSTARV